MLTKITFLSVLAISAPLNAWPDRNYSNCLYAAMESGAPTHQAPCPDSDPFSLMSNKKINEAILLFNIKINELNFRGCELGRFFAMQDHRNEKKFIISYKTGEKKFLAPILHELSHVLQMKSAGGLYALVEKYPSKRIELAADYMTGILFSRLFKDMDLKEFEQNLLLTGLYFESSAKAHGTPAERQSAFRLGVFEKNQRTEKNMSKIELNFQRNIYAAFF